MSSIESLFEVIREGDIKYVDFRFTDLRGRWRHVTYHISSLDETMLENGFLLESAALLGVRSAGETSVLLKPDTSTAVTDPFAAQPQVAIFCDVFDPATGHPHPCCPRGIARRADVYLRETGVADTLYLGPDMQFFVFDDVRYTVDINKVAFELDSGDAAWASGREFEQGNWAHRPGVMDGYLSMSPLDNSIDLRAEMASTLIEMGVPIEKHHHDAASPQHKLGMHWAPLLTCADHVQLYKYVVHMVAHSYGKTATFMPKPLAGDSTSDMRLAQCLWKDEAPLFSGGGYAGLSDMALFYIGGLIKHARALNAFANATTNSYKRLSPESEAPIVLAYSMSDPQAAYGIRHEEGPGKQGVVARYPDPAANPYTTYAAMLLAGLDGIRNKIHPGDPLEHHRKESSKKQKQTREEKVCYSLRNALECLKEDHAFLLQGDVFSSQFIEHYVEVKSHEVRAFDRTPHPLEYKMYYSA